MNLGVEWDSLRSVRPPYQPTVNGPEDTSNFDIEELRPPNNNANNASSGLGVNSTKDSLLNIHLPFVGFTATFTAPEQRLNGRNEKIVKNESFEENGDTVLETLPPLPATAAPNINEVQSETIDGLLDSEKRVALENELRAARQEWSEVSGLLAEMKKEKNSLTNRLRAKEEELEQQLDKNTQLRQQLRNSEKVKRQQVDDIVALQTQLDKERELRIEGILFLPHFHNKY